MIQFFLEGMKESAKAMEVGQAKAAPARHELEEGVGKDLQIQLKEGGQERPAAAGNSRRGKPEPGSYSITRTIRVWASASRRHRWDRGYFEVHRTAK